MNRGLFGISNETVDYVAPGRSAAAPAILSGNTLVGFQAGKSIQGVQGGIGQGTGAGSFNTFIGYEAGAATTTGDSSVFVGYNAAPVATGVTRSVAIGYQAGNGLTIGGSNTLVGYNADATLSSGNFVTAVGAQAGQSNFGSNCTYLGYQSGFTATGGNASTSGTGQTCIGYQSGQASSTAVSYITCLGASTLAGAAGAVAIGTDHTGAGATTSTQDVIALGTANHQVQLANNSTGAGSAALGANCPAVTATAPYTWFKMMSSDGSTVYVPAWK